MKVCKFGGTSLANAEQIRKVCDIVLSDPDRRLVVVSAPGKRNKEDAKVTDLLIALAETALRQCHLIGDNAPGPRRADGRAFFITNGEPVVLWDWINDLLRALDEPPVTRRISLRAATALGVFCEAAWRILPVPGEPPMTRFVAAELATDHWFDLSAARRDLGYHPRVSMAAGTAELVAWYRRQGRHDA